METESNDISSLHALPVNAFPKISGAYMAKGLIADAIITLEVA